MMNECLRRVKGHSITLLVSLQREFNFKSLREEGKEEQEEGGKHRKRRGGWEWRRRVN